MSPTTPLLASLSKLAAFFKAYSCFSFFLLFKKYNHKQTSKTTCTLVKFLLILLDMSNHEKQKQDLGWGGGIGLVFATGTYYVPWLAWNLPQNLQRLPASGSHAGVKVKGHGAQ